MREGLTTLITACIFAVLLAMVLARCMPDF